ncbi:hypothetical protein [Pseudomonas aeruginosa]|uniref:hypothetical protein n=1 Tax=Pseudomonas aeruginosa TaxID=287 RepID=UPI0010500A78|nr:hypothetical protein [Pseudomonas aeruginosa]WCI84095.1 hypothetical protein PMJ90_05115 [Pseudomonas aeruginosa]HBP0119759.1 hypothetical protein [Pseudomonas aeruginosa]
MNKENLVRLTNNVEIVREALETQWCGERDKRALDCVHFDEYCFNVIDIISPISTGLMSEETALKGALKAYTLFVCLYSLNLKQDEVDQENLNLVKDAISKNVENNWPYFYEKIESGYRMKREIKRLTED